MKESKFKIGDWVRFYRNAEIVIGEVRYIHKYGPLGLIQLLTDKGAVDGESVLEMRRLAEFIKGDK